MNQNNRILWAAAIVAVDILIFALPLTALAAGYILIARPPKFKKWIDEIYAAEN